MKVLYINSVVDFGSTGNIVRQLSTIDGVEPLIVYGRKNTKNDANTYKISNDIKTLWAMGSTILFNNELILNKGNTKKLIKKIEEFKPDIIHLHNLHGYYVNYKELFEYLNTKNIKIIWTHHDCWPITGYCPHFDLIKCEKYKTHCENCPYGFDYPFSLFKQNLRKHFNIKKELFTNNDNLTIAVTSNWSKKKIKESFLKDENVVVINNGIKLDDFKPICNKDKEFSILFVANYWTKAKGLEDLEPIIKGINKDIKVTIVGKIKASKYLNERCVLIDRTDSKQELAKLYSKNHLFVNPTYQDVFGLVNVEALACGTPVITYNTGGCPEILNSKCGLVIEKGNTLEMINAINNLYNNYYFLLGDCINRSNDFSLERMKNSYSKLYKELING